MYKNIERCGIADNIFLFSTPPGDIQQQSTRRRSGRSSRQTANRPGGIFQRLKWKYGRPPDVILSRQVGKHVNFRIMVLECMDDVGSFAARSHFLHLYIVVCLGMI